jgi:hypothetical protein
LGRNVPRKVPISEALVETNVKIIETLARLDTLEAETESEVTKTPEF